MGANLCVIKSSWEKTVKPVCRMPGGLAVVNKMASPKYGLPVYDLK